MGWACSEQIPTVIWLHSSSDCAPIAITCSRSRPDLIQAGIPENSGFEFSIGSLPDEWHREGVNVFFCANQEGSCRLTEIGKEITLPKLVDYTQVFTTLAQVFRSDLIPKAAIQACVSLKHFGGYYRQWFFNKRRNQILEVPIGWEPELIALCCGSVLGYPLNPYEDDTYMNLLQDIWSGKKVSFDDHIADSRETYDAFEKPSRPRRPESFTPASRQHFINTVLANSPKVSVVIPSWNRRLTLLRAIDSALHQTIAPSEILVADDGSCDGSLDSIKCVFPEACLSGQIKLLPSFHQGVSASRNRALAASTGEWIAYLDSDNSWHCDHLLFLLYFAFSHYKCPEFLYSGRCFYGPRAKGVIEDIQEFSYAKLQKGNFIDLNCVLHRRGLFEKYGGFCEDLKRLVDWEMALRFLAPANNVSLASVGVTTVNYWRNPGLLSHISVEESWTQARNKISSMYGQS